MEPTRFDEFTKVLATPTTRRQALKAIAATTLGGLLGLGGIGTAFAKNALARGEAIVFVDPEPRTDFLRMKLGGKGYTLARQDVRDLAALVGERPR